MVIKFKKWFENNGLTRYKIILPAENFKNLPGKELAISANFQVIKGEEGYRLTLFGEGRDGWLENVGITPTGLSWKDETLNLANGIHQWSTPWLKKKDLLAVIEKIIPLEVASWKNNSLIKPEFRNLELV
jgi:hypothetical protein